MITYVYKAKRTDTGEMVHANVKAESPQAAAKLLAGQGLFTIEIKPEDESDFSSRLGLKRGVGMKDRVIFTRQLSTLITAGLPLIRALQTAKGQVSNKALRSVLDEVVGAVEGGSTLSDAFAQHPRVFNEIYIAIVGAGETSGTLDKALLRLAIQQEKDAAIISKIRGAMIYPVIVLVLITLVMVLMITQVVPQVASLYADLKKDLPLATKILVGISDLFKNYWYIIVIALGAFIFGSRRVLATERAKLELDKLKLKLPVFGILLKKMYMARFARTMNSLLASGIPMLQALDTSAKAVGNRVIAGEVRKTAELVRGGKNLSTALEKQPNFHPLVPQMAGVGEESGAIDDMLGRTAGYFEDEVEEAVKNISTTLEPIMMVVLGLIVGGLIFAVLGPVYGLISGGDLTSGSSTSTTPAQ